MINPKIEILLATIEDYPIVQNMARFYVYDLSRNCGYQSKDWAIPSNGLYESSDFKSYFEAESRKAYIVKVEKELAGFVLINQEGIFPKTQWNMGEFFVSARFQCQGIGEKVAHKIWHEHPGNWEVAVIPDNNPALRFWKKSVTSYTCGRFDSDVANVDYDDFQPRRVILSFKTQKTKVQGTDHPILIRSCHENDIPKMVELSKQKRLAYEKIQPVFWKYAGPQAEISQACWFAELLHRDDYIIFVAESDRKIVGFIIGNLIKPPEVYMPGGRTLMIDDFCVKTDDTWEKVGVMLLRDLVRSAQLKDASQVIVVCGAHDQVKSSFLRKNSLHRTSDWYVGKI